MGIGDAAAGVPDDILLESLLPDDLAETGAALAEKAQRGGVWRSNDDFAKELQQPSERPAIRSEAGGLAAAEREEGDEEASAPMRDGLLL